MSDNQDRTGSAKKRRLGIHETTLENDIRYLGPLNAQHFKLLGWLCIVISQVAVIVKMGGRLDPGYAADSASLLNALGYVVDLALPFLLIAGFAQILDTDRGYGRQLLVNGAASAGICALTYLVFYRYVVGDLAAVLEDPSEALPAVKSVLTYVTPYGFLDFNIFIDLFLCTLTMVFLNYKPRRVFTGKARIVFRLLALLPIGYEVGCMLLKLRAARGLVQVPVWAYPLLTTKPPMTFVLFVALALFVKTRELRFRRHGKTHEEYQAFLKTRRNSLNFSVFLAIMLVIVSVLDFVVVLGFSVNEVVLTVRPNIEASASPTPSEDGLAAQPTRAAAQPLPAAQRRAFATAQPAPAADADAATEAVEPAATDGALESAEHEALINSSISAGIGIAGAVGFGGSVGLIFLAPLVLLFSYTRKPKYPMLDLAIPVAGIVAIVLVYLEATHQLLSMLPFKKLNLKELNEQTALYLSLMK